MRRKIILKVLGIACVAITGLSSKINDQKTDQSLLTSENIEALARGEVDIPGVYANISQDFCIVFDDGYFLTGVRVA